ncbi:MAG TPA: tRNA pseudouridine synthase A [Dermatophilaceae bacterium]|nr:tRNA pseudouridine synthase A [Dermatophilaceae bacterium]
MLRLTSHPRLTVAGRTDVGVHARGAVAHLDLPGALWRSVAERGRAAEQTALRRLRGVLPQDVGVHRIRPVPKDFDARFSALFRRYQYRICDRPAEADPLRRFETLCHPRPLDEEAMARASSRLLGLADFAAFCRRREGASTIRTLIAFDWGRAADDGVLVATVVADAFCHSMVRALVGAAVAVGEGRRDEAWPLAVRQGRRRDPAVTVMPALGLVLEEVGYPPAELFAERARQSRARREPAPGGG